MYIESDHEAIRVHTSITFDPNIYIGPSMMNVCRSLTACVYDSPEQSKCSAYQAKASRQSQIQPCDDTVLHQSQSSQ